MSIDSLRSELEDPAIVIDGISYIPSSVLLTGIPKITLKDDRAFAVLDSRGESPRIYSNASELGIYFNDTRFISIWEMTVNGDAPVSLSKEIRFSGNTAVCSMTNRDCPDASGTGRIRRDTFLIRRILNLVEDTVFETFEIKNFAQVAHVIRLEHWIGSRFDDIFEVRGFARAKRGRILPTLDVEEAGRRATLLQYEGLDSKTRRAWIYRLFEAEKIRVSPGLTGQFTYIEVPAKKTVSLRTVVSFDKPSNCELYGHKYDDLDIPQQMNLLSKGFLINPFASLDISTDNTLINRAITYAKKDVFTLLTEEENGVLYPYAGIPWYSAPFGRDGLITAYQMLPWFPKLAAGVLNFVFQMLGKNDDAFTDEEPGKVFHELRHGEMSQTREVPFIPYYGSVDSTPLALILLHEYFCWTHDLDKIKEWWPQALRALAWVDRQINADALSLVGYLKRSPTGLTNQGWKDSHDSVMHEDGTLAEGPIHLCEVQGYAFRAKLGMSGLARHLGDNVLSNRLRFEALAIRSRFLSHFWDPEQSYIYLAMDGKGDPCKVMSSNMGHCLWSQIIPSEHARPIAQHLMSKDMFSGYGIRTLSSREAAYNPMSYHNGSVWPHDNSIIMEGLRHYNFRPELETLSLALINVLETSDDFRLPELFCGFRRRENEPPVPYEVACKPQAWAAGSVFLMLKSLIGITMDQDENYLTFHSPTLTDKIRHLEIKGLQCRDWEIDLSLHRTPSGNTTVEAQKKTGRVQILTVR